MVEHMPEVREAPGPTPAPGNTHGHALSDVSARRPEVNSQVWTGSWSHWGLQGRTLPASSIFGDSRCPLACGSPASLCTWVISLCLVFFGLL